MSYKTRKLWFRICAFLVALVMVSGDLAVSAAAVENENGTQIEVSSEDVDNSVEVDASETEGASDETSDEILGEENPNVETDVISEADNYDEKDSEGDSEEDAEAEEDFSGETSEEEKVSDSGEAELQSVIKVKDDSTTDAHGFRDVRIDFNKETACIIYGQYLTADSNEVGGQLSFRIDEYTENTQGAECKYSTSLKGNGTLPVPVDQYQSVNGLGYVLNPSHDGNVRNIPLAKDTKYVKIVAYKIADESAVGETDFIKRDDFPAPSSKLETVGLMDNSATIEFAIQSLYTNSLQGDFTIRYGMKGDENNWNEYSDTPEELYYQNSKEKVYTWEFANLTEGTEYGYTVEADISINVNSVDKPIYSVENSGSFKTKNNSSFVFNEAFPDEAFRKVVVEKVKSLTGKADPSETEIKENLYRITDIYYNEDLTYGKIKSLKGIEYLTGLRYINVDNNDISEFPDMRNNVGLRNGELSILYNKLSDEEVSSIRDKLPAHCGFLSENWIAETRATQNKVKPSGGDVELEYAPVYYNDGNSAKFFVLFNREFGRVEAFVDDTCFTMQNSVYVGGMSLSFEEKSKGKRLYVGDLSGNIGGTKTVTIKAYEYDYESEPEFTKDISVKFDSNLAFVDGSTIQRADAGKNERFYVGTGYRYYSSSNITVAVPNDKTILSAELYLCDEEGNITEKIGENTNAPNYRGQGWFSENLYSKYGIESMSLNMTSWNMDFAVDRLYVSKNCKIKLYYDDDTSAITENCVEFTGEEAGTVLSFVYISWNKDSSEGSEYFYLKLGGININPDELEVQFSNKGKILGVDYISAQGLTPSLSEDFYELKFKKNAEDWQGIGYDSQITCTIKKNGQLLAHKSVTLLYMNSVNGMPLCIYNPQQQELQINLSKDIKAENNRAYVTVTRINQYSGGNTVGYGEKLIDQYVTVNADNSINVALLKTKLAGSSPYFEVEVRVAGRTMIDSFTYYSSGSSYYGGGTSVKSVVVPKIIVMAPDDPENPLTSDDPAYGNVWVDPIVTYTPANANAGIGYYMESSAPDVVEVCGNGTLHALECGKATITVITNNGVKATIQVIVMDINVGRSGISINTKDNPDYERTKQLVLSDGTTNYKPEWTSSNPSVAVVDANGLLTILADNTEDGYAEISATYNGTVFSRWINVVRPVESITATAHKEYLEVWPDGEENLGYFNDTDYISVTSEPAGLINIGDNEYCNTEFNIITECGERYLEIDAYGNVWAKYDPDLGEGKEITVEVTTTTKKWNSDPPTETNRASSEVTYKIVPTDYKRVDHSDGDNVRVRLLSGISGKLGDIELPEALKDDWEWMYPDTDISKYSGMDGAQFAVKHVNKYTHEIHQDFVDVEFVDGPDFWVSWGMEGNLPYFKDERSQGDNAVAPIVYEYWTDGRFEEMYPEYTVDVQAEPNDVLEKDGDLYSSWVDLDNARMEGHKINGFRAKKAGNGEVKVTFTVKDADSRVVYTTLKTLKIKTVDATKKGVAWYDGWIIRMRDPEMAVDDYDNWDWGEDKVDPSDESPEPLRYIRWDENGNVILEEGQKYLFVTASDGYAVKMKSLDTNVVSLGKAVTHKKGLDEGQRDVAIMPIVMGNPGVTTLSVTVSDAINSTMNINVRIKNDKVTLGATKFTLNRAYKGEHQYEEVTVKRGFDDAMCGAYIDDESNGVNFVPGEDGVDIVKISYPEQFDANGKKIKLAAKHKLYLVYGNPEEPDKLRKDEFDITLSESNKAPKATIKQIQNLNTSFKRVEGYDMYDTAGVFSVGIDGEIIDDVGLTFTDKTGDVELTEGKEYSFVGEDGLVYLYADPGKKKIKVTLKSEKYKDVVSTVSAKTEKKTYALSSSTGTVFTDTGIDGSYNPFDVRLVLQVNDSKTKMPVELYDLDGEVEELKVSVEASVTKGNTGNKYIPYVSDDGKHIILEADVENDVPAKTGDVLTIKVKRPEWTAAAEFKYTIKGESISKTSLVLGAKTITVYNYVGVENCSEKTTLSLKGGAAHDMLGEIKIYENIKKGQEYSIGKKFNAYVDPYLGTINVQKVSDDFEGTYNLKLELSGPWKKPISTTLTVKAVKVDPASADSKTGIKCTTSSKGSIDVLNRQTTGVVITPKFTNIPKDARIEVIDYTGPDAHLFYDYGRNNGTVGLRLHSGVRVLTNFEYKVNIKYSISTDNGTYVEVTSPEVKIKFTQSSAKGVLVGNPTFGNAPVEYHSYVLCVANSSGNNMKIRRVDMDETAGFKLYYSDGNPDSPQGTDLENGIVVIRHDFDGTTTTGKTYTLKLLVYPDDAASNSKPVTVTYKVTLAK